MKSKSKKRDSKSLNMPWNQHSRRGWGTKLRTLSASDPKSWAFFFYHPKAEFFLLKCSAHLLISQADFAIKKKKFLQECCFGGFLFFIFTSCLTGCKTTLQNVVRASKASSLKSNKILHSFCHLLYLRR